MVARRHDGSDQSHPALFGSWFLVFSEKSSLFLFAMRCSYLAFLCPALGCESSPPRWVPASMFMSETTAVSMPSRRSAAANSGSHDARRCTSSWKVFVRGMPPRLFLDQFEPQFAADQRGGALQGLDRDVAFRFQDAVDLCTARVHLFSERGLGHALTFHFLGQLPGDDARHRFGLCGFTDTVFSQELIERRAPVGIFLAHAFISFI